MHPYAKIWAFYMAGCVTGCVVQGQILWVPLGVGLILIPAALGGLHYWLQVRPRRRIEAEIEAFQDELEGL
jgi:Flp pilus assembly protein TadB